jgi:predicted nucleic acid-binding protein
VPRYLADTSIWSWSWEKGRPDITAKLVERLAADDVLTCVPVVLEAMHKPDTSAKHTEQFDTVFDPLDWLPLTEEASWRAIDVQRELAARSHGAHRRSVSDFLIAAIAELHQDDDVVLWAFDDDYRIISDVTKQPVELEKSTGAGH